MFEKEIQAAKHNLSQSLLSDASYVYLQEILEKDTVPAFYRVFFGAEVDWWIFEQQMLRNTNPRFDYTGKDLTDTVRRLDSLCRQNARFDHQDLTSLIDLSVKTRVNFLIRPRTTLKWFVYRGEPTKPLREVLLRLAYFSEYTYLTDGFHAWIKQKNNVSSTLDILSVVEFERIIQNIDNDIILEYTTTEFTDLLQPLFEFFRELASLHISGVIPTPALIIFLDDKGIIRISQELEKLLKEEHMEYISKEQFLGVIENVIQEVEEETSGAAFQEIATIPLAFEELVAGQQPREFPTESPALSNQDETDTIDQAAETTESLFEEETVQEPENVIIEESEEPVVEALPEPENAIVEEPAVETVLEPEESEEPAVETVLEPEDVIREESDAIAVETVPEQESMIVEETVVEALPEPENVIMEESEEPAVETTPDSEKGRKEEPDLPMDIFEEKTVQAAPRDMPNERGTRHMPDFELNKRLIDNIFGPSSGESKAQTPARPAAPYQSREKAHESEESGEAQLTAHISSHAAAQQFKSLDQLLDNENQQRLIKKLFRKDEQQFRLALERLNQTHSWKEASSLIDRIYAEQGIDPFSSLAKRFTEIVYNRYIPG